MFGRAISSSIRRSKLSRAYERCSANWLRPLNWHRQRFNWRSASIVRPTIVSMRLWHSIANAASSPPIANLPSGCAPAGGSPGLSCSTTLGGSSRPPRRQEPHERKDCGEHEDIDDDLHHARLIAVADERMQDAPLPARLGK